MLCQVKPKVVNLDAALAAETIFVGVIDWAPICDRNSTRNITFRYFFIEYS